MSIRRKAAWLAAYLEPSPAGRAEVRDRAGGQEDDLTPLLELARRIGAVRHPVLDAAALAAGQVRVQERLGDRSSSRRALRPARWAWVALAAVVALLLATAGTVLAAESSLPGDLLYPVKRAREDIQLALSVSPETRSLALMSFAERRLAEVAAVCAVRDCPPDLLADLERQTRAAVTEIERLPAGGRADLLEKVVVLTSRQQEVLTEVLQRAPLSARPGLERALENSRFGHERARRSLERERGNRPQGPQDRGRKPTEEPPPAHTPKPKPSDKGRPPSEKPNRGQGSRPSGRPR